MIKMMFVCTGNSCRSQMAEGMMRIYGEGIIEPFSAGVSPSRVNPYAIKVMREIDIDISKQKSKAIDPILLRQMDYVITLCGNAEKNCPVTPPQIKRIHWPIDDPAKTAGTKEEILKEFAKTRDKIKDKIKTFLMEVNSAHNNS